ncbi:MAG: STAS-like domain-containing protein [Acidobacteriota bacterium]
MTSTLTDAADRIRVAKDFSEVPGPRNRDEGPNSGQQFLEELLAPAFKNALDAKADLWIDLDGTEGYATSFLESAFGGLARRYSPETVLSILRFKSDEEPYLVEEIRTYIREATDK